MSNKGISSQWRPNKHSSSVAIEHYVYRLRMRRRRKMNNRLERRGK